MPEPPVVANSSCLIALDRVGRAWILERLYGNIVVPAAVARECGTTASASWIQVQTVKNSALVQSLRLDLAAGEAEAIALASELSAAVIILDDKKARGAAKQLGLAVTGTLGVLLLAKERGLIASVRQVMDDLVATNFRISNELAKEVIRHAGE